MSLNKIAPSRLPAEPVETRLAYAKCSDAPDILRVLSHDPFWYVRYRVASNTNTPADSLQALQTDPDFRVRIHAEHTLSLLAEGREAAGAHIKRPLAEQLSLAGSKTAPAPTIPQHSCER